MDALINLLDTNFGVLSTAQLASLEVRTPRIRRCLESGVLKRLRHGWYAGTEPDATVARAVRAGGVLSGAAALALFGVWVPPDQPVHVRLRRREQFIADMSTTAPPLQPVALPASRHVRMDRSADRPGSALLTCMLSCSRDDAVILADSVLRKGILSREDVDVVVARAGFKGSQVMKVVCASADSGTESKFRIWLHRNQIKYRTQVFIAGVGRVDFLIGQRLVVEIDSRAHHTSLDSYTSDRRRDLKLTQLGYRHIRLTYADVMHRLDVVGHDILDIVRRDEHRPMA